MENASSETAGSDPVTSLIDAAKAAIGERIDANASTGNEQTLEEAAQAAAKGKEEAANWKAPDFVPENFRGKNAEETLHNLVKSVTGYRERDAKAEKIPDLADGYQFQPADSVKPYLAEQLADDPIFQAARAAAHELKMPPSVFQGFMNKVLDSMVANGAVERPMNPTEVLQAFVPENLKMAAPDEQMREASKQILAINASFEAFAANQKLPDSVKREAMVLFSSPSGLKLLDSLLPKGDLTPETSIRTGGAPATETVTRDSLKERQADPRNDPTSSSYNKAFAEETRNLYKRIYGNG